MKKRLFPLLCMILAVCITAGSAAVISHAAEGSGVSAAPVFVGETRVKNNINGNSYNRYNSVTRSYLRPVEDGFMRIYGSDNGTLLAEYYDSRFCFVSNRTVAVGLPLFGGFCEYDGRYYVVTGDENPNQDDGKEVFRISCFDTNWEFCGSDSIYGANTVLPFAAGRVAFAASGDRMIIRTTHRIYFSQGANHQTNLTIVFDTAKCRVKDYFCDIATTKSAGYLSHSFNQFVDIDADGTVVCLDHGDAHPREATLGRFTTKADSLVIYGTNAYDFAPIFTYYGDLGDNITAAMVGGLACSDSSYLTVGAIAGQDENYRTNRAYNAYISATPKDAGSLEDAETTITFLSNFSEEDQRYASNPHLVRINDDLFLVMWNEFPVNTSSIYGYVVDAQVEYDENYLMKYVFADGEGKLISDILTAPAGQGFFVSECEPIVCNNRVLWFVSDGDSLNAIIEIGLSGKITIHDHIFPEDVLIYPFDLSRATVSLRTFDSIPDTVVINEENLDDYVVVCYNGRPLERGKEYLLADADPIQITAAQGTVKRIALKLNTVDNYSYFPLSYIYNWSVVNNNLVLNGAERLDDGVHLTVTARRGVGYHIYRKEVQTDGEYELVGTVSDRITSAYVDKTAARSKGYTYIVREYTYDRNGDEVLSAPSGSRAVSPAADDDPTEPPSEPPTDPPSEPEREPILLGDSDADGSITILDATAIQRYLAGLLRNGGIDLDAADSDGAGNVTILDATMIQRYLAGLRTGCAIGERVQPAAA